MKDWAANHPKARLMARKRAAILDAAREAFLRFGYEGTSMEAIASAASVSIMTVYRHAESKDELFAAVISGACDPTDEAEQAKWAKLMSHPLGEVLVATGIEFQQRLASPETTALLRAVMTECSRFPELAEAAYRGFVGHQEQMLELLIEQKAEGKKLSAAARRKISATFLDGLFGADMLRILLGLGGGSPTQHRHRAKRASAEVVAALNSRPMNV